MIIIVERNRDLQIANIPPDFKVKDLILLLSYYLPYNIKDSRLSKQFKMLDLEDILEDNTRYLLHSGNVSSRLRFLEKLIINDIDLTSPDTISATSFPQILCNSIQIDVILTQYIDIKDPTVISVYLDDDCILLNKLYSLSESYIISNVKNGMLTIQIDDICRKFVC